MGRSAVGSTQKPPERIARPTVPVPSAAPAGAGARRFMRQIIPWVLQEMPKKMATAHGMDGGPMSSKAPLAIGEAGTVAGYKEAWNVDHCAESLQKSGLYEAGGNACWVNPQVGDDEDAHDPSWEWVYNYAQTGYVTMDYGEGQATRSRIKFPIVLETYWPNYEKSADPAHPTGLQLLAAHGHVWAWYAAVFDALTGGNDDRLRLLYESALSATVCVRIDCRPASLAAEFILYSERVREDTKGLIINFVTFADKLAELDTQDLGKLQQLKLRFCGGLINATMLKAAQGVKTFLTQESRRMIGELDRGFGREALSGSYSKMRLLFSGCQNKSSDVAVLVEWCLDTMLSMLSRRECSPNDFAVAQFSKSRDGTPSWIAQALATRLIVQHMQTILDNVSTVDAALAAKIRTEVFEKMSSPSLFNQVFPQEEKAGEAVDSPTGMAEAQVADAVEADSPGDLFMSELRNKLPKAGILFAEILRKLFDNTYEEAVKALAVETGDQMARLVSGEELPDLTRDLNEMMRAIHVAENVISSSGGGTCAPKASLRELVRHNSAPEDRESAAAERNDVWKRAVAQRKKLVTLGLHKNPKTAEGFTEVFRKSAARSFKGEVNVSHRAFVLSADLMHQSGREPWLQPSAPTSETLEAAAAFITTQRDTFDLALAFDGTMKEPRRALEDVFSPLSATADFVVVYDKAPNSCFQRKNFMSHRNVEAGFVRMPMNRTRVAVKDRSETGSASGETSTTYTSYSGIQGIPRTALAMIRPEDKTKIFSEETGPLPKRWAASRSSGVPLFWLETKSLEFWGQMCDDLNIKCIVDLSPGSGILAQCCMSRGITYFGMCGSAAHLQWLSNVLDRAALKYIVESGTFLYMEDLATHIKELFADCLESLETTAEDEEAVQASDVEEA